LKAKPGGSISLSGSRATTTSMPHSSCRRSMDASDDTASTRNSAGCFSAIDGAAGCPRVRLSGHRSTYRVCTARNRLDAMLRVWRQAPVPPPRGSTPPDPVGVHDQARRDPKPALATSAPQGARNTPIPRTTAPLSPGASVLTNACLPGAGRPRTGV
jgi:hypothetical protein